MADKETLRIMIEHDLDKDDNSQCCKNPLCRNCLTVNCKNSNCDIHKKVNKIESRVLRGLLFGGRLGFKHSNKEIGLIEKLKRKYYEGDVDVKISDEEKELVNKWMDKLVKTYPLEE